jgi:hypothetical protein
MGLPWVRLDSGITDNPKILALMALKEGRSAGFVYCCGLAYSGKHGTDGFLPMEALPRINGRSADAKALVSVGLWIDQPGGWVVNGWDQFQQSNEETQIRRKKAQAAAQVRWDKAKGKAN